LREKGWTPVPKSSGYALERDGLVIAKYRLAVGMKYKLWRKDGEFLGEFESAEKAAAFAEGAK
jgi:hypothetical protein